MSNKSALLAKEIDFSVSITTEATPAPDQTYKVIQVKGGKTKVVKTKREKPQGDYHLGIFYKQVRDRIPAEILAELQKTYALK